MAKIAVLILVAFLLIAGAISVASIVYLMNEIPQTPLAAHQTEGFIYPFNNHGVIHYVTWFDHCVDVFLRYLALVAVPLLLGLAIWAKTGSRS